MTEFAQDTVKNNIDSPLTPSVLRWLPAAFLLAVVGVGAVVTILVPSVRQWPSGKSIVTGEAMLDYEKNNLDAKVPWRTASVNTWGGLNYRVFSEAREGAVVGKDGWLFTSEEFQTSEGDAAEIQNKVAYIEQVRDQLEKQGATLVVALIPAKVRVYPEYLNAPVPSEKALTYQSVRGALVSAGIIAPNLLSAFQDAKRTSQEPLFFRTDTHWTPRGAEVAATTIAEAVRPLNLDLPAAEYEVKERPEVARSGDLLRYIPVPAGTGPAADRVRPVEYERTDVGGGGLFGDEALAVALVGTSYSADVAANVWQFDGALSRALGTEVLNVAREGRGPILPMLEYLAGLEIKDNPPRIVVWEIPERFLRVHYK